MAEKNKKNATKKHRLNPKKISLKQKIKLATLQKRLTDFCKKKQIILKITIGIHQNFYISLCR